MALSKKDFLFLQKNAYSMDHNTNINNLIFGEPFLNKGILHYFDGQVLEVDGFIMPKGLSEKETKNNIVLTVEEFFKNYKVKILDFFGPIKIDFSLILPDNFELMSIEETNQYNRDMQINLEKYQNKLIKYSRDIQRNIKFAKQNNVIVNPINLDKLSSEHKELIKNFLKTHNVNAINRAWVSCIPKLIKIPSIIIFEGRENSMLKGFMIVDNLYKFPIMMLAFYDNSCRGISSLIYDEVIKFAIRNKSNLVDLGYSIHKNLYDFKLRMGANQFNPELEQNPPSYSIRWKDKNFKINNKTKPWWLNLKIEDVMKYVGIY